MSNFGTHILLDLHDCEPDFLLNSQLIINLLENAAKLAGATLLHSHYHKFGGHGGVSAIVVLAESHISIHTWPENSFAAADIYMCGDTNPNVAVDLIIQQLHCLKPNIKKYNRGFNLE